MSEEYVSLLIAVAYVASIAVALRLLRQWVRSEFPRPTVGRDDAILLGFMVVAVVASAPLLIVLYGVGKVAHRTVARRG